MIKKRSSLTIFCLVLVLILSACSSQEPSSNSSDTGGDDKKNANSNVAQGVTEEEILIGHIGPQTGNAATYDLVRKGIDSYFKYVNENGGIHGRELKLIAYDDQYQPAKTVQSAKRLVETDKVFAMVGNVGTATNLAIKDYVVEKGIPMVMVGTGVDAFVNPPIANYLGSDILNYGIEAEIFLNYAVKELGAKKIAVSYQNDDYGQSILKVLQESIKNYPEAELITEVNFLATDTEFSSQAKKLKDADPDTILHFSTPVPAANMKKALHKVGVVDPTFIVSSVGANDKNLFNLAGQEVWEGTYSGATYPTPEAVPDDEDMKLFVERFSKDNPNDPTTGMSQVGWAAAQVLVEALEQTGEELTWENFLKSFYTFDNWDGSIYAGVTFNENNHYGINSMFMTEAKDGQIVPISEPISFDPENGEVHYTE